MSSPALPAPAPVVALLSARTIHIPDPGGLLERLPSPASVAWVRGGDGLVGWGEAARLEVCGPERFATADRWWQAIAGSMDVTDDVRRPGSGPVAFASFGFADFPGRSVVVVPRVVLGRRGGASWLTVVSYDHEPEDLPDADACVPPAPGAVTWSHGALDAPQWLAAVEAVLARIEAGDVGKVVLARDLVAQASSSVDPRHLLRRLSEGYPSCWTFAVEGLVGATPELLLRLRTGEVTSRVLAGTVRRTGREDVDLAAVAALRTSGKDLDEHEFAVASVAESLRPFCSDLDVPQSPGVLSLSNVWHLATDVRGRLAAAARSLEVVAALHPSAAVGGTPRAEALRVISEVEGMDRGRYAGPVGWMDASGDGEWGIALRCAEVVGDRVRAYAGCGIVAGSVPEAEYAETQDKLMPVREALES